MPRAPPITHVACEHQGVWRGIRESLGGLRVAESERIDLREYTILSRRDQESPVLPYGAVPSPQPGEDAGELLELPLENLEARSE